MYVNVVFNINLSTPFIYKKSSVFKEQSLKFRRVLVPFKNKLQMGFVVEDNVVVEKTSDFKIADVFDVIDNEPVISENEFEFYKWLSEYYIVPIGQTIFNAIPPFSIDHFKIEIIDDNPVLDEAERELFELIKAGTSLKKSQKNIPFFFSLLNNLKEKKTIEVIKKLPKARKIKFVKLTDKANIELKEVFGSQKLLPVEIVKKSVKGYRKLLKEGTFEIIEKSKAFMPENFDSAFKYFRPEQLNEEQERAWKKVKESIDKDEFETHLIFGITGSGKTEIYLKAIEETLKKSKNVIYLVPEISLTPNVAYILLSNFPDCEIAVYHSKISKNLRYELWNNVNNGKVQIIVGARSALFAPVKNLGLIIVDEEHEQSYKQEDKPRYHGRDCAVMKGKINNAVVILGSATPSVQSYYNAKTGKYKLHVLKNRVNNQPLPDFEIIDLKEYQKETALSEPLKKEIKASVEKGEQVILLINKKGYASYFVCRDCGFIYKCKNCELTLTFYKSLNRLICSYCDNRYPVLKECPECKGHFFKLMGKGTEKIVENTINELDNVKAARFDGESTAKHGESVKILKAFNNREIDVIVGTQMIAKGYDFQNVSLVGIISVDNMLNFPDYNSIEKAFQLIVQCSGRAGRKGKKGKVILQTYSPNNYIFNYCKNYKFEEFYEYELEQRKMFDYPPFCSLVHLIFEGNSKDNVKNFAEKGREILEKISKNRIVILGPVESQIKKIRNKYRFSILLKGKSKRFLRETCMKLEESFKNVRGVILKIDIDPISL